MQDALIIVAPNGARKQKSDHANLPITPEEIAAEVEACVEAGAGMVHLHARKPDGQHSLEIEDNLAVLKAVRERVGDNVIVQITTEAIGIYHPEQQMALITAIEPEAASFAIRELIPDKASEQKAYEFFSWVAQKKIIAQYIVYSVEELRKYFDLTERNIIKPDSPHHVLIVLGRYTDKQQSDPADLAPFLPLLSQLNEHNIRWAVCAFGHKEQACLLYAAQLGGDVRIGFENNCYTPRGDLADSNATQVRELVELIQSEGRDVLSADMFRKLN
ncbi:3-keto-5-aminohexanoate cleavage protein [Neptuniibacter caesariensis]|uniref:Class III aminotransferase n=1 Tax=Neptuniibacter caesariensis TaxID=207954 RepID=A0A7U8GRF9_NEPCE|nr:3-keto-5-aminohexanoate cleavage protein [Neptuniibacter caesariensis]EAR60296.1 hypothetical protein MED92_02484 [Oceanospirillum sp. MED92] [Neptuniibacter caesariensis]